MSVFLDICQGIGLAAAAGLRPFLPTLLAGALASYDAGVDFDGTTFDFLEEPLFLGGVLFAAVIATLIQRRLGPEALESGPTGAALAVIAVGLAALLFAGSLDDRQDTWWYGLPAGVAVALLAQGAGRAFFGRVRARLKDKDTREALSLYVDASALLIAGLSVAIPPFSLVAVAFLVFVLVRGRRRGERKYAGLRILR